MKRDNRIFLIGLGMLLAGSLLAAWHIPEGEPSFLGLWRSQDAANLLFDFQSDGSVHLLQDGIDYQVFRYQAGGGGDSQGPPASENGADRPRMTLYDGMGRRLVFLFEVKQNEMIFYLPEAPFEVARKFRREE